MRRKAAAAGPPVDPIDEALAALKPPRKYYQKYYSTRPANEDIWHPPQGVHSFLRAYYHMKSADWKQNAPFPLKARTASEWAKLPRYYVMDLNKNMAETVAPEMPSPAAIAACKWLPDDELRVYSSEFGRTGFQGGLNGYRVRWSVKDPAELRLFSGRSIDVPSLFVSGKERLGRLSNPRRFRENAEDGMHSNGGRTSFGGGWTLGAARAARASKQIARAVSSRQFATRK